MPEASGFNSIGGAFDASLGVALGSAGEGDCIVGGEASGARDAESCANTGAIKANEISRKRAHFCMILYTMPHARKFIQQNSERDCLPKSLTNDQC